MTKLKFDPGDHAFFYEGKRVPSVTQILSALGMMDFSAPWFTEESREKGSRLHEFCQLIDEDDLNWNAIKGDELEPEVQSYLDWKTRARFKPLFSEKPLYSEMYRFAGIPDVVGTFYHSKFKKSYALMDRKRGVAGPATGLQLALYAYLVAENYKIPIGKINRYSIQNLKGAPALIPYTDRREIRIALYLITVFYYANHKNIIKGAWG